MHNRRATRHRSFYRKGSLEISIQAIVVVVLAMTLLGLGLGFVRGMFDDIDETVGGVNEQVRQKILDDLITSDKKVSFPATELTLDKGKSSTLTIGIRNKKDVPLPYTMQFNAISGPDGDLAPEALDDWFQYNQEEAVLGPTESTARAIRLAIPSSGVTQGPYALTFEVIDGTTGSTYDQKDLFIVVRG